MSTETYNESFDIEGPARIRVSNVRGHIDIKPGEEGVILVKAKKHHQTGNNHSTQISIKQESDGLVVAEAKHENSITNWFGLNKPCRVDFSIQVPKTCSVNLNCVSSSGSIEGLEGDIQVQGVSGEIHLKNLKGSLDFNSVSGKITADKLAGSLALNNVSGKVKISDSQISSMIGKTVSGSTTIETPLGEGPYEFKSVSGNMHILTPEDTSCTVYIKSVSGKAKINLPVTSKSGVANKQVIQVGEGGPEVRMKSVSGILKVGSPNYDESQDRSSAEQKIKQKSSDPAPEATEHPKTQMEILQEIETGDISVDEALKQLNL
jgi:hypothetical protein